MTEPPPEKVPWLLDAVQELACRSGGATLYNICLRHAGWGLEWHEPARQGASTDWADGLVVYDYHATLGLALAAEAQRLMLGLTARLTSDRAGREAALVAHDVALVLGRRP